MHRCTLLSRRWRQRERFSASMLSICSSVCLFVCLSVAKMQKTLFSKKTKQFRAMVSINYCRLDVKHLILLRRIQLYRRIFYTNDNVLHKLFCALLLSDCMYDNCMISVFTRDAVSNVYMQFRADLTVLCVDELIQCLYLSFFFLSI